MSEFVENPERYHQAMSSLKFKCRCGHSVVIPKYIRRQICSWCGKWVYKDPKEEFKDNLRIAIRKNSKEKTRRKK